MSKLLKIVIFVIGIGIVIFVTYSLSLLSNASKQASQFDTVNNSVLIPSIQKSIFSLVEKEFDFGKIKQSGPKVEHRFTITYNGEKPVKITGTPTSCACTTAKIDKTTLSKNESATLTVTFDPNLHEEPAGKFFKTVSVLTEPSVGEPPEIKIWIEIDLDLGKDAYKLKAPHDDDHNESGEERH